jgi:hypothetical protein
VRAAGERLDASSEALGPMDRVDGRRALVRALNSFLGRIEGDPDTPELRAFNGWREKFFMDNPDYRYWVAEVSGANVYRITGNVGDSLYQSITVYTGRGVADASAVARIDSEDLRVDSAGDFEVTLAPDPTGAESWVHLPPDATSVWARYVLPATTVDDDGSCVIARVGTEPGHGSDPARFDRDLGRLGQVIARLPEMFILAVTPDLEQPNSVRHWSAMAGGAAFTEPGSHYVRGNWLLGADELVAPWARVQPSPPDPDKVTGSSTELLHTLHPEMAIVHPSGPSLPEECVLGMGADLRNWGFT